MANDDDITELKGLVIEMSAKLDKIEEILNQLTSTGLKAKPIEPIPSASDMEETQELKSQELEKTQAELLRVKKRLDNTYTQQEVVEYFGKVLNDVNSKAEEGKVDYVVSNIDLDLKTEFHKDDEDNTIRMSGAEVSEVGESGVSTVKISIKAIPKNRSK